MRSFEFTFLLLLSFLCFSFCQTCDFESCVDCFTEGSCLWCDSTSKCLKTAEKSECHSDPITSKNNCPRDTSLNNIGTQFIAIFVPLYLTLAIAMVLIHYVRVHVIEPVIDFHVNRRGNLDFSALLDNRIEEIIQSALPPNEELLWADVSLRISRWRNMVPAFVSFLVGLLVLSFLPHFPTGSPYIASLLPIFILLTFPCILMIVVGLHQVIMKKHYSDVYMLTTNGAIIIRQGWRDSKVFHWPFRFMVNIRSVHVMYKVASVYFANRWDITNVETAGSPRSSLFKESRNSHVGFENIVKANEVEELLHRQVNQLSPKTLRNALKYTL